MHAETDQRRERESEARGHSVTEASTPIASRVLNRFQESVWLSLLAQVLLVSAAAWLYFFVRGLTEGRADKAFENARQVLRFEARLWFDLELSLQDAIIDYNTPVTLANWVYIWGHWPVIASTLIWLFLRHRGAYMVLRNALFISGAIGLIIFVLYPVAPPRLLPEFVDTVTERSYSYRVFQPPGLVNRYAAVPSLHFDWNLIVGMSIYKVAHTRIAVAYAIAGPILMAAAVVLTANHFILDAVIGGVVALTGLVLASQAHRRTTRPDVSNDTRSSRPR